MTSSSLSSMPLVAALLWSCSYVVIHAWTPASSLRSIRVSSSKGPLLATRAYSGPAVGYAGGYEEGNPNQNGYYYPPPPPAGTRQDEYYNGNDYRDSRGYDRRPPPEDYPPYTNGYDSAYYDNMPPPPQYDQRHMPPPDTGNYHNNGPVGYDNQYNQDNYYYNNNNNQQQPQPWQQQQQQFQQQQQQQLQQQQDDYNTYNDNINNDYYDPYYNDQAPPPPQAAPPQVYRESSRNRFASTRRMADSRGSFSSSRDNPVSAALARMADLQRPLLQGLLPSMRMMDTMMESLLQPAAAIFDTMILQDDLLDLDAIYQDAQYYLEQDATCAELLGLPLRLDHPFSQSSASTSINGKTQSRTELQFHVDGPWNSGLVQLVATDDGILNMVLLVGQDDARQDQGYHRINIKVDKNSARRNLSSSSSFSSDNNNMPNVVEAEILDRNNDMDNDNAPTMLNGAKESSQRGIPLPPRGPPPRGPPSVQERVPASRVDDAIE